MKIRRSILFRLSIFLLSLVLVINPLNIGGFPRGGKVNAQSSVRPYVVFVNGYQDCCTWGRNNGRPGSLMNIVSGALPPNSEIRYVPWDRFENGANQRSSTSNDAEFLRQAADFINQLDPNRPLILIGHSFGGDSLLSLAPRITRRIQFLGVIDPTAAGGLREPITRRGVPSNVDYFFNRWQQNALASANVVPFDSRLVNGSISGCRAGSCDQSEQSLARRQDGSEIRVSCEAHEVTCDGWRLPGCNLSGCWRGSNGTKAKRLAHNDMPLDEYLQRQMADRIGSVLASFRPPNPISSGPHPNYDQLGARAAGCYYIRSLNNNFRNSNFRWLDAKSDGTGVGLVSGQSHGTVWLLEETNQGSLLRSMNQNHRSSGSYRWLDGMSNGSDVQLVSDTSHGAFWQLEHLRGGSHIRSLNNNFRNNNFRWLDGASNGSVAQLVNGTSHGTLWELSSTSCP